MTKSILFCAIFQRFSARKYLKSLRENQIRENQMRKKWVRENESRAKIDTLKVAFLFYICVPLLPYYLGYKAMAIYPIQGLLAF